MTAIRLTAANSESLSITTGVLAYTIYSLGGYLRVASSGTRVIWQSSFGNGYERRDCLYVSGGFLTLACGNGTDFPETTSTIPISLDTWYHVGVSRSGATSIQLFVEAVADVVVTTSMAGRTAADRMYLGTDGSGFFFDGRLQDWRGWTGVALNAGQWAAEKASPTPVITSGLYGSWPFASGAGRAEDTTNSNDWTENNTPTDEDPYVYPDLEPEAVGEHTIGDPADAAFFNGMRSFSIQKGGRYKLSFPDGPLPSTGLRATVKNAYRGTDTVLVGLPWDGSVPVAGRYDAGWDGNSQAAKEAAGTTRLFVFDGTSIADVEADTTGVTAWQDTANDLVWCLLVGGLTWTHETDDSDEGLEREYVVRLFPA